MTSGLAPAAGTAAAPAVLDGATFDAAARAAAPRLVRTAWLLVGDRHAAEDLVQLALSVVWDKRSSVRDPAAVEGYARTVLARRASARWRRRWNGERPTAVLPETAEPVLDVDAAVVVRAALGTLSRRERSVLVLRYFDDLTVEQTAAALKVSQPAVKAAAERGLTKLRAMDWEGF